MLHMYAHRDNRHIRHMPVDTSKQTNAPVDLREERGELYVECGERDDGPDELDDADRHARRRKDGRGAASTEIVRKSVSLSSDCWCGVSHHWGSIRFFWVCMVHPGRAPVVRFLPRQ